MCIRDSYRVTQGLFGAALKTQLKTLAAQNAVALGYNTARDEMFMEVDNKRLNGQGASINTLECVYTGRLVTGYTSRSDAQTNGNFNTEHTWPQGQFGSADPMQSDMHHLFPTDETANSQRSSFPFGIVTGTPTYQNGGSKLGSNGATTVFEPRDAHKGALARSMFYFVTRYDQNYGDFWTENGVNQESAFRNWNRRFPAGAIERRRNDDIADNTRQRNRNPFIDHPEFVERLAAFTGNADFASAPEVFVSPLSFNFGNVGVGDSSEFQLVIVNQGTANLTVGAISNVNGDVVSILNAPSVVPPKDAARVTVRYKPNRIFSLNAALGISTNDADEPTTTVSISGTTTFTVPVELVNFTATASPNGIQLEWTTASESNNQGFYIERRRAIDDWKTLGFVQGNGTTTKLQSYSFADKSASGKVLYRLKQVDFDGQFEYSPVVEADAPVAQTFALEQNYPNPFNPATSIGYQLPASSKVKLQIFDVLGRTVATLVDARQDAGSYNYNFNASAYRLSSGVYFYRLQADAMVQTKKMILAK
jgi:endonuclease I